MRRNACEKGRREEDEAEEAGEREEEGGGGAGGGGRRRRREEEYLYNKNTQQCRVSNHIFQYLRAQYIGAGIAP